MSKTLFDDYVPLSLYEKKLLLAELKRRLKILS